MKRTIKIHLLILLLLLSCLKIPCADTYEANEHFFLKNGKPLLVKGVVYVPCYPGYLPWELAAKRDLPRDLQFRIREDIQNIKAMGTNTIRLWDAPLFCYQAIQEAGDLSIIQTLWFEVNAEDFQQSAFKEKCKSKIRTTLDKIYSVYPREESCPILAYLVGNELSEASILRTNMLHPEIKSYQGQYVSAPQGSNAVECFIAEMADALRSHEMARYGRRHLISYANEVRTFEMIDTPFLDFRSYNGYSYALYDYGFSSKGSVTKTYFQGWLEALKRKHPSRPLLVTETGLSISPHALHMGAPHFGYGGNLADEQAQALADRWQDMISAKAPLAGLCIHEYLDAWWKFSLEDSYTQDPDDVEEWFGLVSLEKTKNDYKTHFRPSYLKIQSLWKDR